VEQIIQFFPEIPYWIHTLPLIWFQLEDNPQAILRKGFHMMNVNKLLLKLTFLSLGLGVTANAQQAQQPQRPPTVASAWRNVAKRNFLMGFCVGQTLASQQIVLQSGQQIDQATVNALKAAVASCKSKAKSPPSTTQQASSNVGNGPVIQSAGQGLGADSMPVPAQAPVPMTPNGSFQAGQSIL
jgi:hypothetical protein